MGVLAADGSNIINIVEEKYEETLASIKVMENSPGTVNISFNTECEAGVKLGPNHCTNVAASCIGVQRAPLVDLPS